VTITDPSALRAALVAQMKGIEELVTLVRENDANILEYVENENGDLFSRIQSLAPPKILVYLDGIEPQRFPAKLAIAIGIAIRADDPTGIYSAMLQGISTADGADGQPLLCSTIHPNFDPMSIPSMGRRQIAVGQATIFEYWEMRLTFTDRSD